MDSFNEKNNHHHNRICFIGVIGTCIYFVANVSATIPPIKKYEFSGSVNQLSSDIHKFTSLNRNVSSRITDITGNKYNGYGTYMTIEIKRDTTLTEYRLEFENKDSGKTMIQLISAFNERNYKIGGYRINGIGVRKMLNDFENEFLAKLKQQHVSITPL